MPQYVPRARVVVIDDERMLLEIVEALLVRDGFDVRTFSDASAGLAAIEECETDVVLVDILMPGKTGIEILKAVKARCSEIEVIVMTAHATLETVAEAMRAGACDYLLKPFPGRNALADCVRRAVERKRLRE